MKVSDLLNNVFEEELRSDIRHRLRGGLDFELNRAIYKHFKPTIQAKVAAIIEELEPQLSSLVADVDLSSKLAADCEAIAQEVVKNILTVVKERL